MEHSMLNENVMEVRGATSQNAAISYAERVSGRIVDSCQHVALTLYTVTLR
jgi:hypothetical protein